MITILLVILLLMLLGAIPTWPHSRNWGYMPSGTLGLLLIILLVLAVAGRISYRLILKPGHRRSVSS